VPCAADTPRAILERPVQLRGSAAARALLRLAGWRVVFDGLPSRQGVVIVCPHTSTWDFIVAVQAQVPLGLAGLDFVRREVALVDFLQLCGDLDADLTAIAARLGHHRGRRPEWAAPIRLKD